MMFRLFCQRDQPFNAYHERFTAQPGSRARSCPAFGLFLAGYIL